MLQKPPEKTYEYLFICKSMQTLKAGTHYATSRSDMSLRQVAPCVLLAKQVAATRRLFGAQAVISYEGECELVF